MLRPRWQRTALARRHALFATVPLLLALAGCVGALPDSAYVEVESAPPAYETYPHTIYDGEPVYYVDGRWYRHHLHHWAYFRDEPPELYRYRAHIEHAPPAYRRDRRYDEEGRAQAPAVREEAPPAERVR